MELEELVLRTPFQHLVMAGIPSWTVTTFPGGELLASKACQEEGRAVPAAEESATAAIHYDGILYLPPSTTIIQMF